MRGTLPCNGPKKPLKELEKQKQGMTIISASRRTDIPAFYGAWFMNKIARGHCVVKNPFNGKSETVSLKPADVDAFVFWTRNPAPFIKHLDTLYDMGFKFYVQITTIGYPKFIDPASPEPANAAESARRIAQKFGPRSVVWRYDPIILTSATDANWHLQNFAHNMNLMKGVTDTCVISFIDMYKKLDRNFFPLLEKNGVTFLNPAKADLLKLTHKMAELAKEAGISLQTCCEPDFVKEGLHPTSCIDPHRLEDVTGKPFDAIKRVPTRKGCGCIHAKDIGAYDTCVFACAYCYANHSPAKSKVIKAKIDDFSLALSP